MNGDTTLWICGLLFAALTVVLGVAGVVSFAGLQDRWLSSGLVLQGIILALIAGGANFPGSTDLRLGGLTAVGLLIILNLLTPSPEAQSPPQEENAST